MRWIFRILGALVVLVLLAVGMLFLIPSERIAKLAAEQFEAQTGRTLTISGEVKPRLWPQIGVRAEGIVVSNASWSEQPVMLTAERLSVGVDATALMGGAVKVEQMQLDGPKVLLERAADGRANWDFSTHTVATADPVQNTGGATVSAPAPSGAPTDISLALGKITDGEITFVDHAGGVIQRASAIDLEARLPSFQGAARVDGSALYNGAAVNFDGQVATLAAFLEGALSDVSLSLKSGGTDVLLTGKAGLSPLGFSGDAVVESRERAQIFQAIGQIAPKLPSGLGREVIALSSGVTLASEGSLHLRGMKLGLDRNTVSGDVDILTSGPRPKIVANLSAGTLDLTGISQEGRGGPTSAPSAGWSSDPIDVSALQAVDAEITLRTGAIELGAAKLDAVSVRAVNDAGRLVATLNPVTAYGGAVTGEVIVNSRGGLSSRVNLALEGLQMQPALSQFVKFDRLVGTANGRINVLMVGSSLDALMRSLDGEGALSMGRGEILGLDLAGMLRNLDASYRGEGASTIFDGLSASFSVVDGILNNKDLDLKAPLMTATGSGAVNIGQQTVDYRVVPTALADEEGQGIRVPVLINGSWWNIRYRPDLEFLVDEKLEEERRQLEARAREEAAAAEARAKAAAEAKVQELANEVQQKIAEELDVAPETVVDGQSVEDALKKKLEDEISGALGGLLGGN